MMTTLLAPPDSRPKERSTRPKRRTRTATVLGTGACLPDRVIDNDYFGQVLGIETTSEWIERRIGILERRWASHESTTDLAVGAALAALAEAQLEADEVDAIIVATSTPDYTMPSTACLVQGRIGASHALAFDVVNACAGFVYALDAATRYIQASDLRNALVIGVDRGSKLVNPHDRTTSVFFGDGAGAVLVSSEGSGRVLASKLHSLGTSEPLSVRVGGAMRMDGKAIWDFATESLPLSVWELCDIAGIRVDEINLLVPHQANRNILVNACGAIPLPLDRIAINIEHVGNTLAASIPIALNDALANGHAEDGDIVALVGFGAGLAWGGLLLQL